MFFLNPIQHCFGAPSECHKAKGEQGIKLKWTDFTLHIVDKVSIIPMTEITSSYYMLPGRPLCMKTEFSILYSSSQPKIPTAKTVPPKTRALSIH